MEWYEDSAQFTNKRPVPRDFNKYAGPKGLALVDVYRDGRTTAGWGLTQTNGKPGFMHNYMKNKFWDKPRILNFDKRQAPFAFIMRSVRLIMVDIDKHDGGSNGLSSARTLDLPPTLAETSKSGNGRHLFYSVEDSWCEDKGFSVINDTLGILPGIDIRGVGCAYHYETQAWNSLPVVPLSEEVLELLLLKEKQKNTRSDIYRAAAMATLDAEEILVIHDALLADLAKPINIGKRNATLFAVGSQLYDAGVEDWDGRLKQRGIELGLEEEEMDKIIHNIIKYGGKA